MEVEFLVFFGAEAEPILVAGGFYNSVEGGGDGGGLLVGFGFGVVVILAGFEDVIEGGDAEEIW